MSRKNKTPSKGSEAFKALMPSHGDQNTMAQRLDVAQDQVSRWATGAQRPSIEARKMLEAKLGIALLDWDEDPVAPYEHPGAECA